MTYLSRNVRQSCKLVGSILISSLFATATSAQTTFVFHEGNSVGLVGSAFDNQSGSTQFTQNGITLTAEAFLDASSQNSSFNGTNQSFGIDNLNTNASGLDDSDRFDNFGGIESAQFSFDTGGIFQSIDLRFIESNVPNEAELIFDGGSTFALNFATDTGGSADFFLIDEAFAANQLITLRVSPLAPVNTNFALERFTVIPEPNSTVLLFSLCAAGFLVLRKR